ncbi:hypothetical protein CISIN_1g014814mg [Citrus sinensis]|uniref:Uncharacterized protein n=1 Tax=Citrus sinensis TaxID=2711 RepID=A0A067EK13_CITSI|nr:hypothetical protein CISIN_1g014814mg [Citrus sinensis]
MNFPPKMLNQRQRSQIFPSQSTADQLRVKFTRLVSRHDEMKIAYQSLRSQIRIGLNQAEEVFASLAIPMMKLVGLKTVEMAENGRFSTIIIDTDSAEAIKILCFVVENYARKATIAGRELIEKQQSQFIQLINLLRQIETQVNSCQNTMLRHLSRHQISLQKLVQEAIDDLSNLHCQNHDTFFISVKILKALFEHMSFVFGSVETGVDVLMQNLVEHMCNPMVEYVKGLKADIKLGTCARLLAIVAEMDRAMRNGRLELEEAKKRIRVAEAGKIEALCKLKEVEERIWRMTERLQLLPGAKTGQNEVRVRHKLLELMEDLDKDDKLLWELLQKKREYQTPESPMGPGDLLNIEPKSKRHKPIIRETRPLLVYSRVARRCPRDDGLLGPQTPSRATGIPLGSSPSAAIQQAVLSKRINH